MSLSNDRNHSLNLNFLPLLDHKEEFQGIVLVFEDISREMGLDLQTLMDLTRKSQEQVRKGGCGC